MGKPFQSTRPLRGATADISLPALINAVSIHAPLAGRDRVFFFDHS